MGAGGAPTGAPKVPKSGAEGAAPPGGEGNPAEGGCFASTYNGGIFRLYMAMNSFGTRYESLAIRTIAY